MRLHRLIATGITLTSFSLAGACGGDDGDSAEPTSFTLRIENVAPFTHLKSGTFKVPVGATDPGPLAPGDAYEFSFTAGPKHRLSFATMFGQSNDWFFAPAGGSIALYQDDQPISGDITSQIALWDAGTEVDEEPAVGPHTGPNQKNATDGLGDPDPDDAVRTVASPAILTSGDSFDRPSVADMIQVTVTSDAETRMFTVHIENVSEDGVTLMTSDGGKPIRISPGVFSVGAAEDLLFAPGEPDRGEGLEEIAEGGDISVLAPNQAASAGVATPLSPGFYAIHLDGSPLFAAGQADRGQGLENIAEMGDPSALKASFDAMVPDMVSDYGVFNTPAGASDPGPLRANDGNAYEVQLQALPGDRLSFALMFGASNDWFFGSDDIGIALFNDDGTPRSGDLTGEVSLWDAGTELSEEPAVGAHLGKVEGDPDSDTSVREVSTSVYATPVDQHIRVSLTAN